MSSWSASGSELKSLLNGQRGRLFRGLLEIMSGGKGGKYCTLCGFF